MAQQSDKAESHSPGGGGPSSVQPVVPVTVLDVHHGKPVRLQVKVIVPVADHPNYNFVGKLLGPKGNSLKWLQEQTQTKMAILGRGSMRNKEKEDELREKCDTRYAHLHDDLHVEITAYAPAPDAYLRISKALFEIKRFLVPDYYDEIRKQQLRELGVITAEGSDCVPNGGFNNAFSQSEASSSPVGAVVVAASAAGGGGAAGGVPGRSDVNSSTANSRIAPYSWPSEASEITSSPAFWSGQSISAVNCISQHPIRSPAAAAAAVSAVPFKVKPVSSLHQMKPYARPIHHT